MLRPWLHEGPMKFGYAVDCLADNAFKNCAEILVKVSLKLKQGWWVHGGREDAALAAEWSTCLCYSNMQLFVRYSNMQLFVLYSNMHLL